MRLSIRLKRWLKRKWKRLTYLLWIYFVYYCKVLYRNARENLGQVISTREFMIQPAWIQALHNRTLYRLQHNPDIVHIGIDPSGGGEASDYAICSTVYENNQWILVGSETSSSHRYNDIMNLMDNHLIGLRKIPQYRDSLFVVYIEANMSFIEVDRIREHLVSRSQEFGEVFVVSEDPKNKGRYGVWTGETEKELYAKGIRQLMSEGRIHYAENFVSASRPEKESKQQLEDQMRNLRKEAEPCLKPGMDKVKITYTGKAPGVRDDACMSLQIVLHHAQQQRHKPLFLQLCMRRGLRF
jgi:hypothetical protein